MAASSPPSSPASTAGRWPFVSLEALKFCIGYPLCSLRDEAECSLDGVMVLQVQVVTQRRNLRAVVLGPAHIRWRTWDGRKNALVQRGWLPRRPSQRY